MNRNSENKREVEAPAELESQFILRLPPVSINMCYIYILRFRPINDR